MIERFERFSLAIAEISRCWHKLAGEEMKAYGLKGAHATYLTILYRYPAGITVPELCELCLKDKSDASRMLAILKRRAWCARRAVTAARYCLPKPDVPPPSRCGSGHPGRWKPGAKT